MKTKFTLITVLALSALLSACASGRQMTHSNINRIQKNVTTEAQLIEIFGEPTQVSIRSDSNIKKLIYVYSSDNRFGKQVAGTTGSMAGGQIGGAVHPILGAIGSIAGSTAGSGAVASSSQQQHLEVSIDTTTGIVTDYTFTENKTN